MAVTEDDIETWLEWAGGKLMAMPVRGVRPEGPRIAWPDYAPDAKLAYGYNSVRLKYPAPQADEIKIMDEILALPNIIPDPRLRRVVQARTIVNPLNGKHIFGWTRISQKLETSRNTVRLWHRKGILIIVARAPSEKIDTIENFWTTERIFS